MGGWGVGKSTCATDIALWLQEHEPDLPVPSRSVLQVIDTTFEGDRNFINLPADIATCEGLRDCMAAIRKYRADARPEDWLVVDRIDPVWDMSQAAFSEEVFGKDIDQWFLEYRKDNASGHPLAGDYGINWAVIKRMYQAFVTEVMRYPGHVLVTTKAETVQNPSREGKGGDSTEVRAEFSKFGVKPAGEKNLGFLFHTVLLLSEPKQGEWVFTTIRDRNREQVKAKKMERFVTSYLVPIAGWKL